MKLKPEKIAILFNGPKYCGKDTAAAELMEFFGTEAGLFRFTVPVKAETHRRFGLDVAYDHYEDRDIKDEPLPEFNGMSPREAYISVGDDLRKEHGPNIVTKMLCDNIVASDVSIVINPDCGGDREADGIAELLDVDRVLVFRIFKEGHTYEGDCRDWVQSPNLNIVDVVNVEGNSSDYVRTVRNIASMFKASSQKNNIKKGPTPVAPFAYIAG